jgi:hypothetical protein
VLGHLRHAIGRTEGQPHPEMSSMECCGHASRSSALLSHASGKAHPGPRLPYKNSRYVEATPPITRFGMGAGAAADRQQPGGTPGAVVCCPAGGRAGALACTLQTWSGSRGMQQRVLAHTIGSVHARVGPAIVPAHPLFTACPFHPAHPFLQLRPPFLPVRRRWCGLTRRLCAGEAGDGWGA